MLCPDSHISKKAFPNTKQILEKAEAEPLAYCKGNSIYSRFGYILDLTYTLPPSWNGKQTITLQNMKLYAKLLLGLCYCAYENAPQYSPYWEFLILMDNNEDRSTSQFGWMGECISFTKSSYSMTWNEFIQYLVWLVQVSDEAYVKMVQNAKTDFWLDFYCATTSNRFIPEQLQELRDMVNIDPYSLLTVRYY